MHEIVFLTGVFPLVFDVTGVIMWWRGRRSRTSRRAAPPAEANCRRRNDGPRAGVEVQETHAEVPSAAPLPRMAM